MPGRVGKTAIATLMERSSKFLIMLGLPEGEKAATLADVLIGRVYDLPALMRASLSRVQLTSAFGADHHGLTEPIEEFFWVDVLSRIRVIP